MPDRPAPTPSPGIAAVVDACGNGLHHLRLPDGRAAVLKRRRGAPVDFFTAEASGLAELQQQGALRTPAVFALARDWILLEDLGAGRPARGFWEAAGRGLAAQHRRSSGRFGFQVDGYCGDSPQSNTPMADGHAFFAECRLRPQLARAREAGHLRRDDQRRAERLIERLPDLLPAAPAVLLHGDLWLGNLHCCGDGGPALIDGAAVHYGWAEADLAMLTLFGEPPAPFFSAYGASAPLAPDWRERAPVLNLYHLLNHLNLFGASYLSAVRAVLHRFG